MPKTDGVQISNRPVTLNPRNDFARHTLVGGNTMMLDMLARNQTALGVTATGFDTAISRTRSMLESAADLEIVSQSLVNNELVVQLRISNNSGHKLPTSYPSRRVYLHFVVRDDTGNIIFESGRTKPDGSIVGVDADADPKLYEPHYDEINQQDQVQVYEPIMIDTDNNVTYTLLRAAEYIKDNRILPAGFDKNTLNTDIHVAGAAMADTNFIAGSDIITYRINVGLTTPVNYTAQLQYQSLAYGFIKDLFRDNTDPEVAKFETLYNSAAIRSETIASITGSQP
jgi:hypothetical protein